MPTAAERPSGGRWSLTGHYSHKSNSPKSGPVERHREWDYGNRDNFPREYFTDGRPSFVVPPLTHIKNRRPSFLVPPQIDPGWSLSGSYHHRSKSPKSGLIEQYREWDYGSRKKPSQRSRATGYLRTHYSVPTTTMNPCINIFIICLLVFLSIMSWAAWE